MKPESFGVRLHHELMKRGWSQSDFARALWPGETITDSRGYSAPRGRDRVSSWLADKSMPSPPQLRRICEVLQWDIDEVSPGTNLSRTERATPAMSLEMLSGAPDRVLLKINKLVSLKTAVAIAKLIEEEEGASS